MSAVPPNIVGPILQTSVQQQQAARQLASDREAQDALSTQASRRNQQAAHTIAESETDIQVGADSAGGGSQGRALERSDVAADEAPAVSEGLQRGADGQLHLDIEA